MINLIPWCAVKARTGLYEVVTRKGTPVSQWTEFAGDMLYPIRAAVEYPSGCKIVENSRIGGYVDGEGECAEDEND